MPGKVNPVIPELVNLVAFRVMGNDYYGDNRCSPRGQLQLNAYRAGRRPGRHGIAALLYNTSRLFRTKCIDGITVNKRKLEAVHGTTVGIVTALNPVVRAMKRRPSWHANEGEATKVSSKSFAKRKC